MLIELLFETNLNYGKQIILAVVASTRSETHCCIAAATISTQQKLFERTFFATLKIGISLKAITQTQFWQIKFT